MSNEQKIQNKLIGYTDFLKIAAVDEASLQQIVAVMDTLARMKSGSEMALDFMKLNSLTIARTGTEGLIALDAKEKSEAIRDAQMYWTQNKEGSAGGRMRAGGIDPNLANLHGLTDTLEKTSMTIAKKMPDIA